MREREGERGGGKMYRALKRDRESGKEGMEGGKRQSE